VLDLENLEIIFWVNFWKFLINEKISSIRIFVIFLQKCQIEAEIKIEKFQNLALLLGAGTWYGSWCGTWCGTWCGKMVWYI